MSYCKCGGYLGHGGIESYAGRWCNCLKPEQQEDNSYTTNTIVINTPLKVRPPALYVRNDSGYNLDVHIQEDEEGVKSIIIKKGR